MTVFQGRPTSRQVRSFLGMAFADRTVRPKYLICDKGKQFWCAGFRRWCRRKGIRVRYGAVGKHGSIAVIERFIRTLKEEGTRRHIVPLRTASFLRELRLFGDWYNQHRPHTGLDGEVPDERHIRTRRRETHPKLDFRSEALEMRVDFLSVGVIFFSSTSGERHEPVPVTVTSEVIPDSVFDGSLAPSTW